MGVNQRRQKHCASVEFGLQQNQGVEEGGPRKSVVATVQCPQMCFLFSTFCPADLPDYYFGLFLIKERQQISSPKLGKLIS